MAPVRRVVLLDHRTRPIADENRSVVGREGNFMQDGKPGSRLRGRDESVVHVELPQQEAVSFLLPSDGQALTPSSTPDAEQRHRQ